MRRRWLLSLAACAGTVLAVRGIAAKPANAEPITHVAEYVGGFTGDASRAQDRYLRSQPHHWRELVIKK
jgi:hypothetical protein